MYYFPLQVHTPVTPFSPVVFIHFLPDLQILSEKGEKKPLTMFTDCFTHNQDYENIANIASRDRCAKLRHQTSTTK